MTSSNFSTDTLLTQLRWRYATKKFDPTRKIPAEQWAALEQALVLTPSSFGLEPWRFYVVDNPELRQQLVACSWGQQQIVDASHVVVFATKLNIGMSDVEALMQRTCSIRSVPRESLKPFEDMLSGFIKNAPPGFSLTDWATRQVYIALGNFMTSAALLGIDTCPMEGIDPVAYDEKLGLAAQGYKTSVVCCAGYRAADDKYGSLAKVRRTVEDVVVHL